jgi:hypothetical protein
MYVSFNLAKLRSLLVTEIDTGSFPLCAYNVFGMSVAGLLKIRLCDSVVCW